MVVVKIIWFDNSLKNIFKCMAKMPMKNRVLKRQLGLHHIEFIFCKNHFNINFKI